MVSFLPAYPAPAPGGKSDRAVVLVSNRGPVEHYCDGGGRVCSRDSGGGVAVALASIARQVPVTWIAGAASPADRELALSGRSLPVGGRSSLRLVALPDGAYAPFYETFCNPLLWFVQHSLAGKLCSRDVEADAVASWQDGYLPANRAFAGAVIEELDRRDGEARVMLHDYHLYLVARLVRERRPDASLQQFVHIPWPAPEAWSSLGECIVRCICDGLLANDSVVFQTDQDVANFLETCRAVLPRETRVKECLGEIDYAGHTTSVWCNPISVDYEELLDLADSPEVAEFRSSLVPSPRQQTIVRVDRLDPSKNILRGFEAFERLLERNPDLRGRVGFRAFLVPSRTGIAEYDAYARRVFQKVEAINSRFGCPSWTPISVFHEQNRARALACLSLYDVLLVNSLADGMNLVSKEGPAINERDGVLVLSTRAGSFNELRDGAIGIEPQDVEATSRALEAALAMPPRERAERAARLRTAIERHQLNDWFRHLLHDLTVIEHVKALPVA